MTKHDQIIALVKSSPGISLLAVAERIGCHPAYVRTAMHRAGMFRRKHNPDVVYDTSRISIHRQADLDRLAALAETRAESYERDAANCRLPQIRTVPEPQLAKLKAEHWRIIARWIRNNALSIHQQDKGQ